MNTLLGNYEMFKMKSNEIIPKMFTRFTEIVNGLANQGKIFTNVEMVNKLPRVLSNEWSHVKTLVRETMRIQPIAMDEPIGTCMSYEAKHMNEETINKGKKKSLPSKLIIMMQVDQRHLKMKMMRKWHF